MTEEPQEQPDQPAETPETPDVVASDGRAHASETASETPVAATDGQPDTQINAQSARFAELERELASEREQGMDYMRRWQSAQADLANMRRRMQQEQEQRDRLLTWNALAPVVTALDSLERAFLSLPPTLRGYSWIDGIALVDLQLRRALEAQGIRPLNTEPGQSFDPQRHQAIGEVETTEYDEGVIAVVVQQGYEAGPMLLRPTLAQVARAPKTNSEAAEARKSDTSASEAVADDDVTPGPEAPEHAADG